ncbi:MAG: nuclear transport factor 2 family protein [Ilumatobacteraceae bacterium]
MTDQTSDEQTVRLLAEQLITAAGTYDLDTFEGMMAAHANVGWASFRDGAWTTSTMTAEDWIAEARSEVDPILYAEPVDDWTVHVDGGHLAFVRADAVLHIDGRPERHNIDYFTLVKQDGAWKFLTVSYVGRPARRD